MSETKKRLDNYKEFRDFLYLIGSESITEEQLDLLYKQDVTISFCNNTVTIPFDATVYNSLTNLIETIIKEY